MRIVSLHVENFGKLHQFDAELLKGFFTIKQDNGWGKTTLAMFIKSMFYGLSGDRKSLPENERRKFRPWQGGNFGGWIVFEVAGKTYKVTRFFGATQSKDTFELINTHTNKSSNDYSSNLGQELFGLDEEGFVRSVFIATENLQSKQVSSIKQRLADLLEDVGDTKSMDDALAQLDKKRKYLKNNQKNGEIPTLQAKVFEQTRQIEQAKQKQKQVLANKADILELNTQIETKQKTLQALQNQSDAVQKQKELQYLQNTLQEKQTALQDLKQTKQTILKTFKQLPTTQDIVAVREYEQTKQAKQNQIVSTQEMIAREQNSDLANLFANKKISEQQIQEFDMQTHQNTNNMGATVVQTSSVNKTAFALVLAVLLAVLATGTVLTIMQYFWAISLLVVGVLGVMVLGGVYLKQSLSTTLTTQVPTKQSVGTDKQNLKQFLLQFYKENELQQPIAAWKNLKANWNRYLSKLEMIENYQKTKQTFEQDVALQEKRIDEFLQKFVTDSGLEQIESSVYEWAREMLQQLQTVEQQIQKAEQDIAAFLQKHQETLALKPDDTLDVQQLEQQVAELQTQISALVQERVRIDTQTKELELVVDEIFGMQEDLTQLNERLQELEFEYDVVIKTIDYLKQARDNVTGKYLKPMQQAFSKYAKQLKLDMLGKLTFDTDLAMQIEQEGANHELEYFSRGYQDLFQFTMRLALVEVLFEQEKPFLILDDPFTHFDENKVNFVSGVLKTVSEQYQVIYFTCHTSRAI